ncbi:hypothetical protein KAH81_01400 [bacterium]|nr:hypothetical protein [bacterium]
MAGIRFNSIENYSCIEGSITERNFYAKGGTLFPILGLPIKLDLKPIGPKSEQRHYEITGVKAELIYENDIISFGHSNAQLGHISSKRSHPQDILIEFPLNQRILAKIEETRKGDANFEINIELETGILYPLKVDGEKEISVIGERQTVTGTCRLCIAQSDWTKKINDFSYGSIAIIELPMESIDLGEEYKTAVKRLEEAVEKFHKGDYETAVAKCYNALEPLKSSKKTQKIAEMLSEFDRYEDNNGESVAKWFEEVRKKTSGIANRVRHTDKNLHFDRKQAEGIILVTTGLFRYLSSVLREKE